jgi:hypothetical protein
MEQRAPADGARQVLLRALSAGQMYYRTDGFRENNRLSHDVQNVFAQVQPTEWLGLQAEVRRRNTNSGDRRLFFDLNAFDATLHQRVREDTFRVGGNLSWKPGSHLLFSGIFMDREFDLDREFVSGAASEHKTGTTFTKVR